MVRKQKSWNYGTAPEKKRKKVKTDPLGVSGDAINMEYFMYSPLNPMGKIGADYGVETPRIVQTQIPDPEIHGIFFRKGMSDPDLSYIHGLGVYTSEPDIYRKAKEQFTGSIVTDTETMTGTRSPYWYDYRDPEERRTYGTKDYRSPFTGRQIGRKGKGTGYHAVSKVEDVIGLVPRKKIEFTDDVDEAVPTDYGQLESISDLKWQKLKEDFAWGRLYRGDVKVNTRSNTSKLKPAWKQLQTLDHELQHRGFERFRDLVESDPSLKKRLFDKYSTGPIKAILEYNDHPYIYYQSKEDKDRVPKWFTRQMKEIIDQEIFPYFFDRLPSLKRADALQGPAYGDVKGRGTIMKKRRYQTEKKRGTASYAVKTKDKWSGRTYKGSWNY